jgi:uncharacterized protein (DUF2236 family)
MGTVNHMPQDVAGDTGFFGPGSITWQVVSDPVYPIGGLRALLLQALHPRAMAAVAQSGGFQADPWGRLNRTGEYVATLTFGSTEQARRVTARVRGIHRRLRAVDPFTGEPFRVDDPHLLLWVHCCEVESLLSTARRGGADLSDAQADRYLREQVIAATLVGIPEQDVPVTCGELDEYFRAIRPELALTEPASEGLRAIARPPMPTWVRLLTPARPAWGGLAALATTLLPVWARRMYRLPGLRVTDLAATAAVRTLRTGLLRVPEQWREGPAARAAKARIAA